jgi:hypothetical protein
MTGFVFAYPKDTITRNAPEKNTFGAFLNKNCGLTASTNVILFGGGVKET